MRKLLTFILLLTMSLTIWANEYPGYGDIGLEMAFVYADGTPATAEDFDYGVNYNLDLGVAVLNIINVVPVTGELSMPSYVIANGVALPVVGWVVSNVIGEAAALTTSITLPSQLQFILGSLAFPALSSLSIPASVTYIPVNAFGGCNALRSIMLEDGTEPLEIVGSDYYQKGVFALAPIQEAIVGRTIISQQPPFNLSTKLTTLTVRGQGVEILDKEFCNLDSLHSLTIGNGVKSIGNQAFIKCPMLSGVNIPGSVQSIGQSAFEGDTTMTAVTLNEGLKYIDNLAFRDCRHVASLTLPASLDSIHSEAFNGMAGVAALRVADSSRPLHVQNGRYTNLGLFTDMGEFEGYLGRDIVLERNAKPPFFRSNMVTLEMGPNVTTLNPEAFIENRKLRSAALGENLTVIPAKAFYACVALQDVKIPGGVQSVGQSAFEGDTTMAAVTFNEGLRYIDNLAFRDCYRVASLTLPASLDSIHSEAFNGMAGVTALRVADCSRPLHVQNGRYTNLGLFTDMGEFEGYLGRDIVLDRNAKPPFYRSNMVTLEMGPNVTTLNSEAFIENKKLRTATFGENLTVIPAKAFYTCVALQGVNIPGRVQSVGQSAFDGDTTMTAVTFNEGLRYIDNLALRGCYRVALITLPASLDSIHSEAFNGMAGVTALRVADCSRPLHVQNGRYTNLGLFTDMGEFEGYLGRDIVLERNAKPPFFRSNMVTLEMGPNVFTLNPEAFIMNKKLRTAVLSENLTVIPDNAFHTCDSLQGIVIPCSVKSVGKNAFLDDISMTAVTLNEGLKYIDNNAFKNCQKVVSLTLPSSLDSIHGEAFSGMVGVTMLRMSDSTRSLQVQNGRYNAQGLFTDMAVTEAYVGRDVELVRNARAPFYRMSAMKKVTLSDKVTQLHKDYFYNCSGLLDIYSENVVPPVCSTNGSEFSGVNTSTCKVHVPARSIEEYRAANGWKLFFNIVSDDNVIIGDISGDGKVDVSDVNDVINIILELADEGDYPGNADVTGDGKVDVSDVNAIINIILFN